MNGLLRNAERAADSDGRKVAASTDMAMVPLSTPPTIVSAASRARSAGLCAAKGLGA